MSALWCRLFHGKPMTFVRYYSPAGAFIRVFWCRKCQRTVKEEAA